jgi:hypothetical protein
MRGIEPHTHRKHTLDYLQRNQARTRKTRPDAYLGPPFRAAVRHFQQLPEPRADPPIGGCHAARLAGSGNLHCPLLACTNLNLALFYYRRPVAWGGRAQHHGGDGGGDVGRDGGGSVGEMVAATRGRRGEGVAGRWGRWHWGDGGVTCRETGTTVHCRRCSLPRRRCPRPRRESCSSCRRCRLHGGSLRRRYISSPPPFSQWFTGRRLTSPPLPLGALSPVYCSTPPLPRVGSTHVVHHLRGGERVHQFALSSPPPRTMHARIRGPLEQCHLVRFLLYQLSYIPNSLLNLRYNIICVFTTCPKRSSHGHQGPKRM